MWLAVSSLAFAFLLAASPAGAVEIFTAVLDGGQEVPPTGSPATGSATLVLSDDEQSLSYVVTTVGLDFAFHYSCTRRADAGFLEDLKSVPWADKVRLHFSEEGTRADLDQILKGYEDGWHVYTCGPDRYMDAVMEVAERQGFPEDARHLEYFSAPEMPEYENHEFTLKLARSGREFLVPVERTATDVLVENGVHVDVKCSDGICGVCKCGLLSGDVEHRDFVLSEKQRESEVILCQSRAKRPGGVMEIDL